MTKIILAFCLLLQVSGISDEVVTAYTSWTEKYEI